MKISTSKDLTRITIEPAETLVIEFDPNGYNALPSTRDLLGFAIGTMFVPGGEMAITISLPREKSYRMEDGTFVLCNTEGYEELIYEIGEPVRLKKVEYPHVSIPGE